MPYVITIDGPAMAGKTTTAKALADVLGFRHVNTGAVYRALAVWQCRHPSCPIGAHNVSGALVDKNGACTQIMREGETDLGPYLYTAEASDMSSRISEDPEVRRAANGIIRDICKDHDIVVEGRDTGSALFPDADLKIYLYADVKARTRRMRPGDKAGKTVEQCMADLEARDHRDSTRACDPLVRTKDMILVDNENLSVQETVQTICVLWRNGHAD